MRKNPTHSTLVLTLRRLFLGLLIGSIGCLATGCPHRRTQDPTHIVTPWEGLLQNLFDDSIDPPSVGLRPTTTEPENANTNRGQAAHYIVRVRVATITKKGTGSELQYIISLATTGEPIAGPQPSEEALTLTIKRESPSFGLVQALDMKLAGTRFIAFIREFPREPDQEGPNFHWHLADDSPTTIDAAIQGARLATDPTANSEPNRGPAAASDP